MMSQLAIDFSPRARNSDPQTSKQAAKRVDKFDRGHYRVILDALAYGPASIHQIAKRTERLKPHLDHVQVARRCPELASAGYIQRRGEMRTQNGEILIHCETRPSPTGNPAHVWQLTGRKG